MGAGLIPVVWDREWVRDLLPNDWPLKFKTPGEGAEAILEALKDYARYSRWLRSWMKQRFGDRLNFADLIEEVWREYTIGLGDAIRLVDGRGSRKSL